MRRIGSRSRPEKITHGRKRAGHKRIYPPSGRRTYDADRAMEVGARVWITTTEDQWQPGVLDDCRDDNDGTDNPIVRVRLNDDDSTVVTSAANVFLRNDVDNFADVPNLISLQYLHEPELLHAVCNRYEQHAIYTYVGEILLSFNPFQRLDLYTPAHIEAYAAAAAVMKAPDDTALPPHVFAIAAVAYQSLCDEHKNQSILVSGESGAGKTENTKLLMQYLTTVGATTTTTASPTSTVHPPSSRRQRARGTQSTASSHDIQTQILQTNPILEAFGNARTVRNDNSSRFGKFIELQFGDHHKIVGAKLSVYLLEKIRVSHQSDNERNFHIFYELCAGADDELAAALSLSDAEDFALLNESGCFTRRDGVDDAAQFQETSKAFTDMGILQDEQRSIFGIVAALLHLGNVGLDGTTCEASNMEHATIDAESRHHLDTAATLLGVSPMELTQALVTRHVTTTKDKIMVKLSPGQANEAKQSLTQSLFGGLFKWIVARLSSVIRHDAASVNTIGILDIFGFENLVSNGFEQLCINYANERLQAQFNDLVFAKEQRMYEAEGIEWKYIEYPDNAPCLQLLEDRPMGMWCLLDEEGMLPKGSNEGWITKLYSQYLDSSFDNTSPPSTTAMGNHLHGRRRQSEPLPPKHQLFHKPSTVAADIPTISDTPRPFLATNGHRVDFQFIISHFAGKVLYEKDAYLQKNQDTLPAEAIDLCGWSTCPIVRSLLAATPGQLEKSKKASQQQSTHRPLARQPSNLRSTSVSAQFRFQLDDLIQVIGCTQARFIRCVKSNDEGVPAKLTPPRVLQQLRSGGVLEAVRIARAGYAVRVDHDRFLDAFGFFGKWSAASKAKQGPSALSRLQAKPKPRAALSPSELKAQVETTAASMLVHYHKGAPSLISAEVLAVAIQVVHAGKVLDRDVFQATCGTVGFQIGRSKVFFRKDVYNALRRFRVMTQCLQATCIQRLVRGLFARRLVATMHRALVRLQTWTRERLAYRARRLAGAIVLQTWWRGVLAQTRYTRQRRAIPRLQRWLRSRRWRRVLAQRILAKQKSAPKFPPKEPPPMVKSKPHVPITVVQVAAEKSVVVPTPPPPLSPVKMVATAPLPRPHEVSLDASEIPQQLPRREVDALMVSLSVENAHLKQEVIQLRRQQQTVTSPVVAETPPMDPSLEFAISHIRTLATQLVELQLQCALMQNADHHPSVETPHNALLANATPPHNPANSQWTLDLVLPPPPVNLTEAHVQLQTLVGKIQVAAQSLDQLERQKRHQMKIRATEAQAMAVVQTLQPVVATVRNVVSYVPVVSYVVSQVETRVHVSPKTWCLLLQTSQSIVDTVTSLAASLLSRGDARRPPPSPLKELHSDALVPPHLKHQLDEMMETNLNQAMQIKQLTATVHDLRAKHHALQLKMLEDQVAALHVAKGQDNEKLKRMEDDLAYTTACVAQLANTMLARGVAKDKSQVVAAFDARPDLPGHFRR